jgi:hypothetical protein
MRAYWHTIGLSLVICLLQGLHAEEQTTCDSPMSYESHNQIDPKPIRLKTIRGVAIDEEGVAVWNLCLGLFAEKDRKLIVSIRAGEDGRFALKDISPGDYRLVAKSPGFCTANVPLRVGSRSSGSKTELVLHMNATGIDKCSYGDLAKSKPEGLKPKPMTAGGRPLTLRR